MSKSMQSTSFEAVKYGIVSSINRAKATARVHFEDCDDAVSDELSVVPFRTMKTKHYWMPSVGEQVIVLFAANAPDTGFIIGAVYSDVDTPPEEIGEQDCIGIWFEDGTILKYDLDTKTLVMDCTGKINIVAKQPINIKAESDMFLDGNLHVTKDIIAGGVSLVDHVHPSPGGTTGTPTKG